MSAAQLWTTACSWRACCIAIARAFHGLTSLPASVTGKTCTEGLRRWYERGMINITIVRAHHHTARALKKGHGSGLRTIWSGLTTKIHAVCGVLGNPAEFDITPNQDTDITQAEPLRENIYPDAFLADKDVMRTG